ncbi:MAG: hydrogenase formation protein HypD [Bacteroidetes bacterium]|nr:hydrogenase formation protein HypD [Bacteroidota bacterium]
MRFVHEYRKASGVNLLAQQIHRTVTKPWTIMEVCGGQTHSIISYGVDELLPPEVTLVHGPGCPVCVTPLEIIDKAIIVASRPDVIFTSFGDMMRVPGSMKDLLTVKAEGGDVRIVYSPLDALNIAIQNPKKKVVFFAIGFETTAPANALSLLYAKKEGITNYFLLCSHVRVPPAIRAIIQSPGNTIQAFLAAGHVCTVMGYEEYIPLAQQFRVPIVVTGFEPIDILSGVLRTVRLLEEGKYIVVNHYKRSVTREGNKEAKKILETVFEIVDWKWRGIGVIPESGYSLRPEYEKFDAEKIFNVENIVAQESEVCIAGSILQGAKKPVHCPAFGTQCTPDHPLGAPMVSSEGACAAYYRSKRSVL